MKLSHAGSQNVLLIPARLHHSEDGQAGHNGRTGVHRDPRSRGSLPWRASGALSGAALRLAADERGALPRAHTRIAAGRRVPSSRPGRGHPAMTAAVGIPVNADLVALAKAKLATQPLRTAELDRL